jgi:hypothetical protein
MLLLASFIIFMLFAKTPGDFIDGNITLTAARAAELKAILASTSRCSPAISTGWDSCCAAI